MIALPGAVRREAERMVIRSRAGDQQATAMITLIGRAVASGKANKRHVRAYNAILDYIDRHPEEKTGVGAEAADALRSLALEGNPAQRCAILSGLPLVGGPMALGIAALILAEGPGPIPAREMVQCIADPGVAALVMDPSCGQPKSVAEASAQHVGRVLRDAWEIHVMRAGDFASLVTVDPILALELGEVCADDNAPIALELP